MRNYYLHRLVFFVLFSFILYQQLYSQENVLSKEQALQLVVENASLLNIPSAEIKNVIVSDAYHDKLAKADMVYLQQAYKGIGVWNAIRVLAFKNRRLVSATRGFIGKIEKRVNVPGGVPSVTPSVAVSAAANHVNHPIQGIPAPAAADHPNRKTNFGTLGVSKENITAKLAWVGSEAGRLQLCWQVEYSPISTSDYWLINVDALNGTVVSKVNLTVNDQWGKRGSKGPSVKKGKDEPEELPDAMDDIQSTTGTTSGAAVTSATYRVIPFPAESIKHPGGTPAIVTDPWENAGAGNLAATLGWHEDRGAKRDSTRGNNVWAREDTSGTNRVIGGDAVISTTPLPSLTFDFAFDSVASPNTVSNHRFAVTQLFYWNNIMHDISYQYGFDEPAGNFQNTNLSRGGEGSDYVIADAQDGEWYNNANFATPEDGQRPRMQMYLFSSPFDTFHVNSPASLAGYKTVRESGFSIHNKLSKVGPLTGNVELYNSDDPSDSFGCNSLPGKPLIGKIALIYRGVCFFSEKVKNAQDEGAIGAIVVNYDNSVFSMGGFDDSITIPAVLIGKDDGDSIKAVLLGNTKVNVTISAGTDLDGDLDNGIIAHEYTHGISTRLTGGPANPYCLFNDEQMGEGWSDYFALMTTTDWATAKVTDGIKTRPMGTYVLGEDPVTGPGIRTYPYTTDMSINPWTYDFLADSTDGESHSIGEIWTSVLWDMTWSLIEMDGINKNLYDAEAAGGNSVALKLVTEGMKLQPCFPGFLDGRDAILKADTLLFDAKYSCTIWKAFARRGMGLLAEQGSSQSYKDQAGNDNPNIAGLKKSADKSVASQNDEITYTLTASCKCGPIANYTIVDTLADNVDYVSGGTYNSADRTVSFPVPALGSNQSLSYILKVKVKNGVHEKTDTVLNESILTSTVPADWNAPLSSGKRWRVSTVRSHSAPYSFKAIDSDSTVKLILATSRSFKIEGSSSLSFWHYYDTDEYFDFGTLELSTDGGNKWIDAKPYFYENGYNYIYGFTGNSGGFVRSSLNLAPFNNKNVMLRFVLSSDFIVGGEGWYVDDILLTSEAGVYNLSQLFDPNGKMQSLSDTLITIADNLPLVWGAFTAQKNEATSLLKWTTMQEHNTAGFTVERSTDALQFYSIGQVKATGESNRPEKYSFTDLTPAQGVNYYRIRQFDKDNRFSYSAVRSLDFEAVKGLITVTPNPAKDKITILITGNDKPLQATLINAAGQKMETFIISAEKTLHNLPKISAGIYYLKIEGDKLSALKKLVIK